MSDEQKTGRAAILADLLVEMFAASASFERIIATIEDYFHAEFLEKLPGSIVYGLTTGDYSDYTVVGVFSSKENAQFIADRMQYVGNIAEWKLDPAVNELRAGLMLWIVRMLRDGTTESARSDPDSYQAPEYRIWRRNRETGLPDVLDARVYARDEAHAVKIVNEIRTRLIANNEW